MKLLKTLLVLLLWGTSSAWALELYPQFGLEFTLGANKLSLVSPWAGLRLGLSNNASFLLKYYAHSLKYAYTSYDAVADQDVELTRKANLSNFTAGIYYQKGKWTAWGAGSFMIGPDGYKAQVVDIGAGRELLKRLTVEGGLYFLREDSILWYPDELRRMINIYSLKAGLKLKILEGLWLNPQANVYWNSEDVTAQSYYLGLIIVPTEPLFITLAYSRYSESSINRFSGSYFTAGLNFYY